MKKRIFSGIQPSGDIHIGNYLGAIRNWVKLTEEFDSIFCIVDYHAMTNIYDAEMMQQRIFNAALANMACGINPEKCTLFVQSQVPAHTELCWLLNCVTPMGELSRMTQFKEKSRQNEKNITAGLLDYPVLQAADILLYKAEVVPVGDDQIQHIEFAREVCRKFNARFGEAFPEPQARLSTATRVMGLDGKNKMSKSLNNYIGVLESEEEMWAKLRTAFTDENRKRRSDPGDPAICNIFTLHKAFSTEDEVAQVESDCKGACIGCVDCKKILLKNMTAALAPVHDRAEALKANPATVTDALAAGAERCRTIAAETMDDVRKKTGLR